MTQAQKPPKKDKSFWSLDENSVEALRERRYLWMARSYMVMAVVAFVTLVMMVMALNGLMPLTRVQPFYLYTQDKNDQVLYVRRPAAGSLDLDMVADSLIRQYLLLRLSVPADAHMLEEIWGVDGDISWKSAPTVFKEFQPLANILIQQARQEGLVRDVELLSVSKFRSEPDGDVWRAEVKMTDMKKGSVEPTSKKWVVNLKVNFYPNREGLKWAQRLKNPLGFLVTKYGMQVME